MERTATRPQAARGQPGGQSDTGNGQDGRTGSRRTGKTAHGGPPDSWTPTGSTELRSRAMRTMHSTDRKGSPGARPPTGQLLGVPPDGGSDAHTCPTGQADPTEGCTAIPRHPQMRTRGIRCTTKGGSGHANGGGGRRR